MTAQVLQIKNQRQSVQKRPKEGMRGRTVGVARSPPPLVLVGVIWATHHCSHALRPMKW